MKPVPKLRKLKADGRLALGHFSHGVTYSMMWNFVALHCSKNHHMEEFASALRNLTLSH